MKPGVRPRSCPTSRNTRASLVVHGALALAALLPLLPLRKTPVAVSQSRAASEPVSNTDPVAAGPQPGQIMRRAAAGTLSSRFRILSAQDINRGAGSEVETARQLADWACTAPEEAAAWAWHFHDSDRQRRHLAQVLAAWSARDPAAAAAWAQAREPGPLRDLAFCVVAQEWAGPDPAAAAALALACTDETLREETLAHVARAWAARAPEAACQWMASLAPGQAGDRVRHTLALAVAAHDPRTAARLALTWLPPGPELDRALVGIVQRWAERNPAEAAAWLEQFPALPLRVAATENLVRVWLQDGWGAVGSWIESMPAGGLRDEAAAAVARVAGPYDAQAARAWAGLIASPEAREACLAALGL